MKRRVEPEILDGLAADDPAAQASRSDLRRIHFLMGNERWISSRATGWAEVAARGIVEWGAGGGELLARLARLGPAMGVDRVARPAGLAAEIGWRQADLMEVEVTGGLLVCNLVLHHFEDAALRELGRRMSGFERVVAVEPWRSRLALGWSAGMHPWVSAVTRHDMPASIWAGFRPGELAAALGLAPERWRIAERVDWRGGLRWVACRRDDPGGAGAAQC